MEVNTDSAPVPLARSVSLRIRSPCLLPLSASRLHVLIFHLGLQWSSFVLLIIFKKKKKKNGSVNPSKSIDGCFLFAASCSSRSFFFLIQFLFKGVKFTVFQERPGKRTTGGNNAATQL